VHVRPRLLFTASAEASFGVFADGDGQFTQLFLGLLGTGDERLALRRLPLSFPLTGLHRRRKARWSLSHQRSAQSRLRILSALMG